MKNILFLLIIIALAFILTSCPDEDPVKPNPCDGKKPVTAEFEIMEKLPIDNLIMKNIDDTVLTFNHIILKAIGKYNSYRWRIIDDPRTYSGSQHVVQFEHPYGELIIELIVEGTPDLKCFPNDDGIDTLYRKIYVKERSNTLICGKYKGVNSSNKFDTFMVNIFPIMIDKNNLKGIAVHNINRGCFDTTFYSIAKITFNNSFLYFDLEGTDNMTNTCLSPVGKCKLDSNNYDKIRIDYSYRPKNIYINEIFEGWRVK